MKSSGYGGSGSSSNNNSRRRTRASPRDDEQGTNRGGEWMGTESTEYEWMDDDEDEDDVEEWANASNSYNNYANDIGKTNDVYSVSSSFQDIKEEDEMLYEVIGYSYSIPRIVLFGTLCVFSLGFLVLFCFWLPFLYVRLTCSKCKLSRARFVLIRSDKSQKSPDVSKVFRYKAQGSKFNLRTVGTSSTYVRSGNTEAIFLSPSTSPNSVSPFPSKSPTQGLSSLSSSSSAAAAAAAAASPNGPGSTKKHVNSKKVDIGHRYFLVIMHKEFRYIYSKMHKTFVRVSFETRLPFSELRKLTNVGYTDEEREEKSNLYGENIIHLPRSNTFYLAVTEIFQPFFIFQILSFMLWVAELYYSYAVFVVCVVVFLVTWNVLDIKTELEKVKELVFETSDVNVVRYNVDRQSYEIITKDSSEIIPGDIISLGDEMTIPCDMIMLSGNAIVDESALTGESCPILKYSIPKNSYELFDPPKHQKYTLFAGTELICVKNSDEPAIALAVHTGFNTTKGHIVRSILHPPESTISLHHDTWLCLGALFVASTVLAVYSVYNSLMRHQALIDVFTYALDMYATGIPPEIPVILMSCSIRAVSAMKKRHLHCISPKYINEAGKIELIAFDKTGTLTEAGLEVCGVCLPYVSELQSESESENEGVVHVHKKLRSWLTLTPPQEKLGKCLPILASCHSLTMFEDKIIGDPIDIEMFKFTGWKLEERFEGSEMSTIAVPPLATANGNDPESINGGNGDGNNDSSSANGDGAENNYLMRSSYMDSSSSSDDSDYSDDSSSSSDYDNSGTSDSGDGSGSDRNGNGISDDDDDDDDEDEDPTGHTKFKKKTFRWKGSMNRNGIVTVKRFEFNPELRRQVVIIKSFEVNAYAVVAKGAPEVIKRLCQPATIPTNFDMVLASLASQGKRVLGLAGKKLNVGRPQDVRDMRQEDVENGLEFHGLLVLSNTLKPESAPVIAELSAANIRSVMVTGDNMQTAVNVSKACGIISPELPVYYGELRNGHVCWVPSSPGMPELDTLTLTPISDYSTSSPEPDEPLPRTNSRGSSNRNNNNNHHYKNDDSNDSECGDECRPLQSAGYGLRSKYKYALAIHGDAFQVLLEGNLVTYHALLSKAQVFARMKPDQKTTLIKTFENVLDVYTCMCGDGANDCGALQAADVGLSIGDSEASIAGVFTSEVENISTVPDLIKEGRCSLLISFTMAKFMVLYSMIGIDSLIFVYLVGADYSDWEFFYYDVVLIYPLYFAMSQITAVDKISPKPPPDSLFTPQIIGSIIGQLIPQIVFITMMYWMLNQEPWYIIPDTGTEVIYNIHATAVMFWFCNYQYLIAGFLFSFGREYHKPVYKCFWVMAICAFIFIANAFVLFQNIPAVSSFFEFPHGDYFSSSTSSTSSGSVPLENPYPVPYSFRWKIFGMAMLNFILSFAIEEFMIRIFPSIAAWYSKRFGRKPGVFTPKARREFEKMHHTNNKGSSSSSSSSNTAGNGYGTSDYHSHYSEGGSNGGVGGPCSVSPNSDGEAEAFIAARGKMKRGQKAKMDMVLAMYEKSIRKSRGKSPGLPEDDNDNEAMVEEENISNNNNNNAVRPQKSSSKGKKGKSSGGKGGRGSRSAASGIVTTSSIPSFAGASRRKSPKKKSGGYVRIYDEEDSYDDSARSSYNVSIDNNNDLSSSGMYYNSNPNTYNNNNNNSDSNNGDVCVTISDDDDENNNNNSD